MHFAEDAGIGITDIKCSGTSWVPGWIVLHSFYMPVRDVEACKQTFDDAFEIIEIIGFLTAGPIFWCLSRETDDKMLILLCEIVHGQSVITGENRADFEESQVLLMMGNVAAHGAEQASLSGFEMTI